MNGRCWTRAYVEEKMRVPPLGFTLIPKLLFCKYPYNEIGLFESISYGDLLYKLKKIVTTYFFYRQLIKIMSHYIESIQSWLTTLLFIARWRVGHQTL